MEETLITRQQTIANTRFAGICAKVAGMSEAVGSDATPRGGWLLGPIPDLFLGTGLAYVFVFIWLASDIEGARQAVPLWVLAIVTIFISIPHYGATLLRVYERRSERRAYFFFAVHATLVLAALFFGGLYSAAIGSLVFTIYLTWSPWHYTGQNYGIALMFLYRNGVSVSPAIKRLIYASFVLSFLITFAFIHGSYAKNDLAPGEIGFVALGIPALGVDFFIFVALVAYAVVTLFFLVALLRKSSPRAIAPAGVLVGVQALWFVVPALYRNWFPYGRLESLSAREATYFFIWIAFGHAVQYLWITSYFAKTSRRSETHAGFYLKALLAGALLWTVPALLFRRGLMGPLPYDGGLAMMIAAVVNLHHFILDGAIWKLRDGRIARALLRKSTRTAASDDDEPASVAWRWATIGALGEIRSRNGEWSGAVEAYETALQLRPDSVNLRRLLGEAWIELGELDRAQDILSDALREAPEDRRLHETMNRVARRQPRSQEP